MAVSAAAGIISGLLAAAIAHLDGAEEASGWQWIFLIEGVITIVLAIFTHFCLIDTPQRSQKWLDAEEVRYLGIQSMIKEGSTDIDATSGNSNRNIFRDLTVVLFNWRYWCFGFLFHAGGACGYGMRPNLSFTTEVSPLNYANSTLCRPQVLHPHHRARSRLHQVPVAAPQHDPLPLWRHVGDSHQC